LLNINVIFYEGSLLPQGEGQDEGL
jgi:hypothetical protein